MRFLTFNKGQGRGVESSTLFRPFETTVLPTTTISPVAPRKTIFKRTRRLLPLRAKVLTTSMMSYNATPPYAHAVKVKRRPWQRRCMVGNTGWSESTGIISSVLFGNPRT